MPPPTADRLPLGDFVSALQTRLDALTHRELTAVLLGHARRLPVGERPAFLDIFVGGEPANEPVRSLLSEIEAFVAKVAAGGFADEDDWYDDSFGGGYEEEHPSWVPTADALFAAVADAFVDGNLEVARCAYELLLSAFVWTDDDAGSLELWKVADTDVPEALARHLRCVYETTPPADRAAAVHHAYVSLPSESGSPTWHDVEASRVEPMADLDAFLPEWIDALLADIARPSAVKRVELLAEAADLHAGVDGLAALVRRVGSHQGGIGVLWIDALTAADRRHDALAAAHDVLGLPHLAATHVSAIADRLAELAAELGDLDEAVDARRRAWRAQPTHSRLVALAADVRMAHSGPLSKILAADADAVRGTDRLSCELLLIASRVEVAVAAVQRSDPHGWYDPTHPGPAVLTYLWVAAVGSAPAAGDRGHLGRKFAALDLEVDVARAFVTWPDIRPMRRPDRVSRVSNATLTSLLAEAIREHPGSPADRDRWIATAATLADARIEAVVSTKSRHAYAHVASLAHAHAEALAAMDRGAEARSHLAAIRARYPRHVAFRRELDAAARTSTLGAHPARRSP